MRLLRRMLLFSWNAKKSNERMLRDADTTRSPIKRIRKRQATFFGHVMRREKLESRGNWNDRGETQQGKTA